MRQMKSPHHNWMSSPALGTTSPSQDQVDGKTKTRLYLSEGPVRIYSVSTGLGVASPGGMVGGCG